MLSNAFASLKKIVSLYYCPAQRAQAQSSIYLYLYFTLLYLYSTLFIQKYTHYLYKNIHIILAYSPSHITFSLFSLPLFYQQK